SQPLSSQLIADEDDDEDAVDVLLAKPQAQRVETVGGRVVEKGVKGVKERGRLPERRKGYIQKAIVGGHKVYLHTGEYEDGKLGEIFIDIDTVGTEMRAMMNHIAIPA